MLSRGIYTAASAMLGQMVRNDLVANNLANANTNGYKKDDSLHSEFPKILISQLGGDARLGGGLGSTPNLGYLGTGTVIREVYTDHSQGNMRQTDQALDLALSGQGYFVVEEGGQYLFTRDGSFSLDNEGYLVTKEGYRVQGENGPIRVDNDQFVVNELGEIIDGDLTLDRLMVAEFAEPAKLTKVGSSFYQESAASGQPLRGENVRIVQGFLESSNVNPVQEMVKMITVMRAYESCQKVIQYQDSTLEQAVTELGRV